MVKVQDKKLTTSTNRLITPKKLDEIILIKHNSMLLVAFFIDIMRISNITDLYWMVETIFCNAVVHTEMLGQEFIEKCVDFKSYKISILDFYDYLTKYSRQTKKEYRAMITQLKRQITRCETNISFYTGKPQYAQELSKNEEKLSALKETLEMIEEMDEGQ